MEVCKIIFLSKLVIWRFHANLPGRTPNNSPFHKGILGTLPHHPHRKWTPPPTVNVERLEVPKAFDRAMQVAEKKVG